MAGAHNQFGLTGEGRAIVLAFLRPCAYLRVIQTLLATSGLAPQGAGAKLLFPV